MPRFAANLSLMYAEHPFLDRFAAARRDGFEAVEFLFPYEHAPAVLAGQLAAQGLQQVLFNAPPGDFAAGERGLASRPGREAEFRDGLLRALDYAFALACPRLHVMAGLLASPADHAEQHRTYLHNLAWAAQRAGDVGVTLLIEPINPRDMPGYFVSRQDEAHAVVETLATPWVKVQMDLYHCQIVEGDLATKLGRWLPGGHVGHLQVAGVPGRQEPDGGELNWPWLFALIDELGYDGFIGCEYRPRAGTSEGLGWLRRLRATSPGS
jgi:2-dehydrotetronate isomerase